jgi:Kef-type K+ transport system membrane component KefB
MHYLAEGHIFTFLIQISLLWIFARGMGELFRRWKQPAITAEILAGIILGPTIFGFLFPSVHSWVFPSDILQQNMLETIAWVGVLFFLLQTGLETDFSSIWKQKGEAFTIAITDVLVPIIITFVAIMFIPSSWMGSPEQIMLFALFIATIMTISALPVTVRVLNDLNINKTDLGFLIIGALSLNDIIGWVIFTLVLAMATHTALNIYATGSILAGTIVFTVFCLTLGRVLTDKLIIKMKDMKMPEPGSSLTLICLLGAICGAITLKIGIHALFGFFLAGIMAGDSKVIPEKTKHVISQMVHAVFIPIFFASIGLKINFVENFHWFPVLFISVLGIGARYIGAWLGVTFTRHSNINRPLISIAHTPGGEMQIVVGILALEAGLIKEPIFVAIVFGAIISSVILGPWMSSSLGKRKKINVFEFFSRSALIPEIMSRDKEGAIRELVDVISLQSNMPREEDIRTAVMDREGKMGTAIENGVAIPHARLANLNRPVIAVGRSSGGIEWNSPDGSLVNLIFLILTPQDKDWIQLQILRFIATAMSDEAKRKDIVEKKNVYDIWSGLRTISSDSFVLKPSA